MIAAFVLAVVPSYVDKPAYTEWQPVIFGSVAVLASLAQGRALPGAAWLRRSAERNPTACTAFRRDAVGFVFQFFDLIPSLTARENMELVLDLTGRAGSGWPSLGHWSRSCRCCCVTSPPGRHMETARVVRGLLRRLQQQERDTTCYW